ncbi:hypothetical protein O3M35_010899 [Rhynocoris fuscipes]|uniref:pseudouridine 5'-phosphatase n=1 Tax=Rhynocoris fuscipes TaxID=488301 RepID=A0AAW1D6R8_9HEMI
MFANLRTHIVSRLSYSTMCSFKKITHVIFDLDGLILDSEDRYKEAFTTVLARYGKKYTDEVRLAVLGTVEKETARIIVEKLQLPLTAEEFNKTAKIEQSKVLGDVNLKPGAERLIRHLSNNKIPIAIATSSGKQSYDIKVKKHQDIISHFHHVVNGSSDPEVKNGKPAPDIFLIAAQRFKENTPKPEDCLVFEDAPNGVKGAKDAGMQVVMVPEDYIPEEMRKDATLVIKSLNDFKPELFGLPPFPESSTK